MVGFGNAAAVTTDAGIAVNEPAAGAEAAPAAPAATDATDEG